MYYGIIATLPDLAIVTGLLPAFIKQIETAVSHMVHRKRTMVFVCFIH